MGWFRTLLQYWRNPKGRHDIKDYAKGLFVILLTAAVIIVLVRLLFS